jgi:hypothetical protein
MFVMELEDRGDLGLGQPPVARDLAVVLVDATVALLPVVELILANAQPRDDPLDGDAGAFGPLENVVDDLIARVVGNPNSS